MANKKELFRLPDGTIAYLEMKSVNKIMKEKGVAPDGFVQMFHTQNVLRRIIKYMPRVSGMTIKTAITQTNIRKPLIVVNTPYAKFLYHGKLMVGDVSGSPWAKRYETKHTASVPLQYDKSKNPNAGPYWDRRLKAAEGRALEADLQRFIKRGNRIE